MLNDLDSEVRTTSINRLGDFVRILDIQTVVEKIIPCLRARKDDQYEYVRAALAENILSLCPILGEELTLQHISPIMCELIKDKCPEVRLKMFIRIEDLSMVISLD